MNSELEDLRVHSFYKSFISVKDDENISNQVKQNYCK